MCVHEHVHTDATADVGINKTGREELYKSIKISIAFDQNNVFSLSGFCAYNLSKLRPGTHEALRFV